MDNEHGSCAPKRVSLLRGDDFSNRILSRNSSMGFSSRVDYYQSSAGVPFDWERRPGTPKHSPEEESILPPLSPPPAVLSLRLPKPCIDVNEPKPSVFLKFKFWKQNKIGQAIKRVKGGAKEGHLVDFGGSDKFMNVEIFSSDGESLVSPCDSSSSSSSSSFSFSNARSLQLPSRAASRHRDFPNRLHGCNPWTLTSVLVRVAPRV